MSCSLYMFLDNRNIGTFFGASGVERPFLLMTRPLRTDLQGVSFAFPNPPSKDWSPNTITFPTAFVQVKPNDASLFVVLVALEAAHHPEDISVAWLMRVDLQPFNVTASRVFNMGTENLDYAVRTPMLVENSPGHQFVYSLLQNSDGSGLLAMDTMSNDGVEDVSSIVMMPELDQNECSLTKGQSNCPQCQACADITAGANQSSSSFFLSTSC